MNTQQENAEKLYGKLGNGPVPLWVAGYLIGRNAGYVGSLIKHFPELFSLVKVQKRKHIEKLHTRG